MTTDVQIIIFNLTGHRSIAPVPTTVRKIEAYTKGARACGLSDFEIAGDVAAFWPSARRSISVETLPGGEIRVCVMPARAPAATRRSKTPVAVGRD
ncbi:MAG: hypothetical protein JOZ42_05495 [Acetobacteraceae bacterium]|nr:hypothetical protein [Acetobacteraceae bacterium]